MGLEPPNLHCIVSLALLSTSSLHSFHNTIAHQIDKLKEPTTTLPSRFHGLLEHLVQNPDLLYTDYPHVLMHNDLSTINVLVSPESSAVTAILDWENASVEPFGMALYTLADIGGNMNGEG